MPLSASDDERRSDHPNPYLAPGIEAEEPEQDATKEPADRLDSPPLAWMIGAIVISVAAYFGPWLPSLAVSESPLLVQLEYVLLSVSRAALGGIGLGLLACAIYRRRLLRLLPGHWIAIAGLCHVAAEVMAQQTATGPDLEIGLQSFRQASIAQTMLEYLAGTLFFAVMAIGSPETAVWRWMAGLRSGVFLLNFLFVLLKLIEAQSFEDWPRGALNLATIAILGLNLTTFLLFIIALVLDWRNRTPRDTWHWIAIGLTVAPVVCAMTVSLYFQFFPPQWDL